MYRGIAEKAYSQPLNKLFLRGSEDLTYGQIIESIEKLSTLFIEKKVSKGSWVLVSVRSPARFSEIVLALLSNSIGVNIVDPDLTAHEAQNLIENSKPAFIIIDSGLPEKWRLDQLAERPEILFTVLTAPKKGLLGKMLGGRKSGADNTGNNYPAIILDKNRTLPQAHTDRETPGYIVNTSGTTSDPKGVMISVRSYLNTLGCRSKKYSISDESRILNVLSVFAGDGLGQGPLLSFYNGCTWVRPAEFQSKTLPFILDSIYTCHVTHFITVPVMISLICKLGEEYIDSFREESLQMVLSTAALLPKELWHEFEKKFGVELTNQYGLTECSVGIYSGPDMQSRKVGTVGKPYNCEVKILDENDSPCLPNEPGELWMTSASLMDGYLFNASATEEIIVDGWLKTGDIACRDEDGFISIVGRSKQMISFAGHTLNPLEISEAIETLSGVREVSVFGQSRGDWGEVPIAVIVKEPGSSINAEDVLTYCRERLIEYKLPRKVIFIDALSRSANGKIAHKKLASLRKDASSTSGQGLEEKIYEIARTCFRTTQRLNSEDNAATVSGWDSLAHMELVLRIEKEFGIRFEAREIMVIESLGQMIELANIKVGNG
jgi:long-chain acyl-CoA synthetase